MNSGGIFFSEYLTHSGDMRRDRSPPPLKGPEPIFPQAAGGRNSDGSKNDLFA